VVPDLIAASGIFRRSASDQIKADAYRHQEGAVANLDSPLASQGHVARWVASHSLTVVKLTGQTKAFGLIDEDAGEREIATETFVLCR
jgi:hypothetical protein